MAMKIFVCALLATVSLAARVNDTLGPRAVKGHQLEYVAAVWRHGDRAPTASFKNDLYPESFWDYGYGQLTNYGIEQHRELGKWIRARYIEAFKFLPETFDGDAIKIRSTYINRTRESALYNFKGLYGENITFDTLNIVSPSDSDLDIVGVPYRHCNYTDQLGAAGLNTSEVANYLSDNQKLLEFLEDANNLKPSVLLYLMVLADSLTTEKAKGLNLSAEYEAIYDQIYDFYVKAFEFNYGFGVSTQNGVNWRFELVKMMSGGLFNSFVHDLKVISFCNNVFHKIFNPICYQRASTELKYRVFSAHDVNVLGFLNNLNFSYLDYDRNDDAPLCSAIFVELWKDPLTQAEYIKVIYRRSEDEIFDLSEEIPDCKSIGKGLGCSVDDFVARSEKYRIRNESEYCAQQLTLSN
ncbi:unnamed protein product [Bursaphelenchus xylophilus]|uniref:acid phosphatase n=1 Tax=Bursaphelenchus xylophilus TaxID=6326 RepID=A0A1I7RYM2_BURXY|nr:unnamed protein product [Bursaphelenchus xylophilus]CAG9092527.1 unnamed protein product [Bursaphelenchus xylophilus]